ncbi:hypothetical protein [Bradyrhizobium sp. S69]|uniref:hypothetical protein n=1 Tax=Bradyrhizobium sp. S69 TaxID=1641856 RepID=UPI00131C62D2|nr:hypothetical protein [Bradyrhizobium sp. S69]
MATAAKRLARSWASDREPIALVQKLDLEAIAKKTGRKPEAILKTARRLGISLKSADRRKAKRR